MDDHTFDPKASELRRFEVITGTGGRRNWPAEVKARIVAESLAPGVQVSDVARRHGIRPQQLFGWRREAREVRLSTQLDGDRGHSDIVLSKVSDGHGGGALMEGERKSETIRLRVRGRGGRRAFGIPPQTRDRSRRGERE